MDHSAGPGSLLIGGRREIVGAGRGPNKLSENTAEKSRQGCKLEIYTWPLQWFVLCIRRRSGELQKVGWENGSPAYEAPPKQTGSICRKLEGLSDLELPRPRLSSPYILYISTPLYETSSCPHSISSL